MSPSSFDSLKSLIGFAIGTVLILHYVEAESSVKIALMFLYACVLILSENTLLRNNQEKPYYAHLYFEKVSKLEQRIKELEEVYEILDSVEDELEILEEKLKQLGKINNHIT